MSSERCITDPRCFTISVTKCAERIYSRRCGVVWWKRNSLVPVAIRSGVRLNRDHVVDLCRFGLQFVENFDFTFIDRSTSKYGFLFPRTRQATYWDPYSLTVLDCAIWACSGTRVTSSPFVTAFSIFSSTSNSMFLYKTASAAIRSLIAQTYLT